MTVTAAGDQRTNRLARQRRLRQETVHRARRDQVGVILLSVRGNQNHPSTRQTSFPRQPPGDVKTALPTKVNVEQRDVGPQLGRPLDSLSSTRRHADNHHPLAFQQATSGIQEPRAVINNQTAQRHHTRIARAAGAPCEQLRVSPGSSPLPSHNVDDHGTCRPPASGSSRRQEGPSSAGTRRRG